MSTDFKALCAELLDVIDSLPCETNYRNESRCVFSIDEDVVFRARAAPAQPEPDASQLSDGYHTFAELYEHRHALCLALMRAMPQHWWFSWRHADGELCFGGSDWFIVGAELPGGDSVTYHLPAELYPVAVATGASELREGRPWDGHNAADVVTRLKKWAALAQPEPEGYSEGPLSEFSDEGMPLG